MNVTIENKEFRTYSMNARGVARALLTRQILDEALTRLETLCTLEGTTVGGREFAITRTKFEEAGFFAIKAISLQPDNQIHDEGGKL